MVLSYVDDLLVLSDNKVKLDSPMKNVSKTLPVKDMGFETDYFGMKHVHN